MKTLTILGIFIALTIHSFGQMPPALKPHSDGYDRSRRALIASGDAALGKWGHGKMGSGKMGSGDKKEMCAIWVSVRILTIDRSKTPQRGEERNGV